MATANLELIIDGDGHIIEDNEGIARFMPKYYREHDALSMALFPPLDHLHSAKAMTTPGGLARRGKTIGPSEWSVFLQDVGIDTTVLYPTAALAYGKIVNRDWAIAVCRAYNNWLHETYLKRSPRFKGMALIPMQEPQAAVEELRRTVQELGMVGAMLPSMGLPNHLGALEYWPVYAEAERLGCGLAVHGGCHSGFGLDFMNVYTPVHALGHPFGQMVSFGGILFNGVFDRYPNIRIAFLEGGVAWFLLCLERFDRSHATHTEYHLRGTELLGPKADEKVSEYIQRHIDAGRIFVGCEGSEPAIGYAVKAVGSKPFLYSSDYPHEVTNSICKEEIHEILENDELTVEDKEDILHRNSQRFYNLRPVAV
jgi:hypothetical protein